MAPDDIAIGVPSEKKNRRRRLYLQLTAHTLKYTQTRQNYCSDVATVDIIEIRMRTRK